MIDTSERKLLADHVAQLNQNGQLGLPLGCDFNAERAERWTDRVTGTEYLRLFPALLRKPNLGFAPQTVTLLDSIVCNLGPTAGAQFAVDFTAANTNTGTGYWHSPRTPGRTKTMDMLAWICTDESFGALRHQIFGKDNVQGVADAIKQARPLTGRWRNLTLTMRRLFRSSRRDRYGRPTYDPRANWSVSSTPLRELLPQLGGLNSKLYGLAEDLCVNQEHADSWAQLRFKHPIYWAPSLAREGDKIKRSVVPTVLHYAAESLSSTAVFLGLYAATIQGSNTVAVQEREGYILAEALNCLARAHALHVCADLQKEDAGSTDISADVIAGKDFEDAYIAAYKAIGAKFDQVLSSYD